MGVKLAHVRFLQILRDRDSALVEGVLGDGLVGVDGTQAIAGHNLAVRGVARCVFYHVVLERRADAKVCSLQKFVIGYVDNNIKQQPFLQ